MARLIFLLTTAALLGLAVPAGAEPLGRLFFSADERATLDQQRQKSGGVSTSTEQVTLNGIVRHSSGKTTAWINQLPQHENEQPQGVAVLRQTTKAPALPLLLPSGKKVNLKAGQTFDATRGGIREGYEETTFSPPPQEAKK